MAHRSRLKVPLLQIHFLLLISLFSIVECAKPVPKAFPVGSAEVTKLKAFLKANTRLNKLYSLMLVKSVTVSSFFDYLVVVLDNNKMTMVLPENAAYDKIPTAAKKKMNSDAKPLGNLLRYHCIRSKLDVKSLSAAKAGTVYNTFQNEVIVRHASVGKVSIRLGPPKANSSIIGGVISTAEVYTSGQLTIHIGDKYIIPPNYA